MSMSSCATDDGQVSFDEFLAFMAEEHADAETGAQLLDAFKVLAGDKVISTHALPRYSR